jgi:hypothetical protein
MSAHYTISAAMIRDAEALAGAREIDVRRVVLGMSSFDAARTRIVAALAAVGADSDFLERLAAAARPLNPYVPGAGATDINAERTPRK